MPGFGCGCSEADWSVNEYIDIMCFWCYIKLNNYSTIMCIDKLGFLAVLPAVNLFVLNPVIKINVFGLMALR